LNFSNTLARTLPFGYEATIRAAFDAWEAVASIDFVEVATDSSAVNIRLGENSIDGASGTLGIAHTRYTRGSIINVDIECDIAETWALSDSNSFDVFEVAVHESGHAIGIGHSYDRDAIMYFQALGTNNLGTDDIAAAVTWEPLTAMGTRIGLRFLLSRAKFI
jgi:hypothetical protein